MVTFIYCFSITDKDVTRVYSSKLSLSVTVLLEMKSATRNFTAKCVNSKMPEYDRLLTALVCDFIGCFRSNLSDLTCPITRDRTNQTVKQPIKINHFMALANKL